jgi:hypothetical protein
VLQRRETSSAALKYEEERKEKKRHRGKRKASWPTQHRLTYQQM